MFILHILILPFNFQKHDSTIFYHCDTDINVSFGVHFLFGVYLLGSVSFRRTPRECVRTIDMSY